MPVLGLVLTVCPADVLSGVAVSSQPIDARSFDVVFDAFEGRVERVDEHPAAVRVHLRRLVIENWGLE